jgi:organic radical activating enzyme
MHPTSGVNEPFFRVAEVYMFDTCTHKCGYCWLAESGQVLDFTQLEPFRDLSFVGKISSFFVSRTTAQSKWLVQLSGGEPLIAPNLDRLAMPIMEAGNRVAFYTALLVGHKHPGFQFMLQHPYPEVGYVMASFHPEAELDEPKYFDKIRMLKEQGHKVFLRFVAHPQRLHRLQALSDRCQELDICFLPATLLSDNYPRAYKPEEKNLLRGYFSSLSQFIQLEGGLDTTNLVCHAGDRIIAVNLKTGNITPCITVHSPSLGNIFEDRLELNEKPIRCPEPGINCVCDVHYQQNVVVSVEDQQRFELQLSGFVPPQDFSSTIDALRQKEMVFYGNRNMGIGGVVNDTRLFYSADEIRENYRKAHGLPRTTLRRKNLREIEGAVLEMQTVSEQTQVDRDVSTRIVTPAAQWSYAVAFPLDLPADLEGEIWVRIRAGVKKGKVGFGTLNRAGNGFQDRAFVTADTSARTIFLSITDAADISSLVVENASDTGEPSELDIEEVIVLADAAPDEPKPSPDVASQGLAARLGR